MLKSPSLLATAPPTCFSPDKTAGFLDSRSIEPCSEGSRCSSEEYRAEGGPLYHVCHAICRKVWYGIIIWIFFFAVAFIVALFRLVIGGDTEVFSAMMTSTFDMSKTGFEISLGLTGVLTLWMGIMKIGERGGAVQVM